MKPLNKILIGLGILALMIITGSIVNTIKNRQIATQAAKYAITEEYLKQKALEHVIDKKEIDSLKTDRAGLIAIIDFQKNNPHIIIQKYETIHHGIDQLSPNDNHKLFTGNIAKYNTNRKRYSLHRFKR